MKNLYAKNKGKIHPSPSSTSPPQSPGHALAMLKLLPAAILTLTAVLGEEDKEVLAYLITRSLHASASETEKKKCKKPPTGPDHSPLFDCGCFDCYTSFWIRWDSSQDRELIHQVIEAFEEHLAQSEKRARGGRRRERRAEKAKGKEKKVEVVVEKVEEVEKKEVEETVEVAVESAGDESEGAGEESVAAGERRRSWPDVMGIFNPRLWNLWSPGV